MSTCRFCPVTKAVTSSAAYTCPRCTAPYCSLNCYRSAAHSECSEAFYKDCVHAELSGGGVDADTRRKALEAIQRLENAEAGAASELDSDDDDDAAPLSARLEGVSLDDPDRVWGALGDGERAEFHRLIETGQIQKLLPEFVPWWAQRPKNPIIDEVVAGAVGDAQSAYKLSCPSVDLASIPPLSSLLRSKPPSPLVKFAVLNVLYAYVYAVRLYGGDVSSSSVGLSGLAIGLSANLRRGEAFESADVALESAASAANQSPSAFVSFEFSRAAKRDVAAIVRGPDDRQQTAFYTIAAIADMRRIMRQAAKTLKVAGGGGDEVSAAAEVAGGGGGEDVSLQEIKSAVLRLQFYMAWAKDNPRAFMLSRGSEAEMKKFAHNEERR